MPKGQFIVMKTGFYPMKVRLKLYFDWGIQFNEQYAVPENGNRKVAYAEKNGQSQDAPAQKQRKRTSKHKGPANRQNRPLKEVAPHNRESEVVQDGPV